jgi:hypothetical protein
VLPAPLPAKVLPGEGKISLRHGEIRTAQSSLQSKDVPSPLKKRMAKEWRRS